MQKITEVAKSFEQHAKQQSEATEKAVKAELGRLVLALKEELNSAETSLQSDINRLKRRHWMHAALSVLPLTVLVMLAVLGTSATWGWYVFGSKTRHLTTIEVTEDGSKWATCKKTYHDPKDKTQAQPTYCLLE